MTAYDSEIRQFVDDDNAYLAWLEDHPNGFVVNCHRKPVSSYLKLHRSSCSYISSPTRGNWTTKDYVKVCADTVSPLQQWTVSTTGGLIDPCKQCKPDVSSQDSAQSVSDPLSPPETRGSGMNESSLNLKCGLNIASPLARLRRNL